MASVPFPFRPQTPSDAIGGNMEGHAVIVAVQLHVGPRFVTGSVSWSPEGEWRVRSTRPIVAHASVKELLDELAEHLGTALESRGSGGAEPLWELDQ